MEFRHTSVLREETIEGVFTDPSGIYVDCTLGGGGHSLALSEKLTRDALLIGIDQDKEAIEANKKFLIGSAIGKSILNLSNLANAFAKRPQFIGAAAIPNVEYPDVTGSMTADMNRSLGTYRSGISRYSAEKGLSPDVRIGAEGEALSKELEQRAKISALQNENQIAQTTANAQINEANIKNQYECKIADQERMDAINKGRSLLYQQGLTNIGKIGTELGTGLIEQRNRMLDTEALNKYITLYQDAVATGKYKGGFYDYM